MPALAPISVASIIIGFISFAFTLAIWLNSFWEAFVTVGHADTQIKDNLSLLRQQLYEELEYLRMMRQRERDRHPPPPPPPPKKHRHSSHRHSHSYRDDDLDTDDQDIYRGAGRIRVVMDSVRDLIREFKVYERPFLDLPGKTHRRTEKDLEWSYDATKQRYQCDLSQRLIWLRVKGGVLNISNKLQTIQTHRAAIEATECRLMLIDAMGLIRDCSRRLDVIEDVARNLEERIVGIR